MIEKPTSPPVCARCDDTHWMELEDSLGQWKRWPCTACPVPCQKCRVGGTGAFCGSTPCACTCHAPEKT